MNRRPNRQVNAITTTLFYEFLTLHCHDQTT